MSKPIALWLTDTHLSDDTIEVNNLVYAQVLEICERLEILGIIHGGDVFDSRKSQSERVLTAFSNILSEFQRSNINFVVIPGNHDKTNYTSTDSFLNAFEGWDRFFLYKEAGYIDHSAGKLRLHFLPYFDEQLSYETYLTHACTNIRFDYSNILFTHVAVSGVKNNDGTVVTNNLTSEHFKKFHKVFVGHYHNTQQFDNIVYTGSTHQANFGEDEIKGCTVLYDDGTHEFIQLTFPRYITLIAQSPTTLLPAINDVDKFRVKFKYKPAQEEVHRLQASGLKVMTDFEIEHIDHIQDVKTEFTHSDIVEYFNQWCDEKGIKDKEFGLKLLAA